MHPSHVSGASVSRNISNDNPNQLLTNPNPPSDTHHDPSHIQEATPNPKPALTILDAPDAGGRTRRILPVPAMLCLSGRKVFI